MTVLNRFLYANGNPAAVTSYIKSIGNEALREFTAM